MNVNFLFKIAVIGGEMVSAITGIFHLNNEPINTQQSEMMMNSLQQFPSDSIGTWQKSTIFLGCHTQWITPESIGEPLPDYDYKRELVITSDAIIDNREELFDQLL